MPAVAVRARSRVCAAPESEDEAVPIRTAVACALLLCTVPAVCAQAETAPPADPLASSQWPAMYHRFFRDAPVVFDDLVTVALPPAAEDSMQVPVSARVRSGVAVDTLLAFIDFNPIPKVLEYRPLAAEPYLGFRVRVQQATPVRVAARTADGVWHVGGAWVDAGGGGCTLPSANAAKVREEDIGHVAARRWPLDGLGSRVKLRIAHPNDTGLIGGTPAFFVEALDFRDADGRRLAELHTFEPVAESPVFVLELHTDGPVRIAGHDNTAGRIAGEAP